MKKLLYIIIIVSAFVFASCDKDEEVPVGIVNIENLKITPLPTSAELTWTINTNATVSDVEFEYATDSKFNDYKTADVTLKNNQCSVSLSSLKLKTEYYIRCRAINNISNVTTYLGSFTTLESSTPVLTKVTVSDVTGTKATCQFEIISDGGQKMLNCGICYSTERNPTIESNRVSASVQKIGVKECTLQDLSVETTYYVRAYATNVKGTAYSDEIEFTTIESDYIIIYTASAKLAETTSTNSDGLHTNAFGGISIVSHEFANGKGAITFRKKLTIIGDYAFLGCYGLTSVSIPKSVTSIGHSAFKSCSVTSIEIPNGVTSIGDSAFYLCSRLTSIEIPNSVTSIGARAFEYCSALRNVTISNSVKSIGEHTFYQCSSLTSVEIPSSVTSIGECAFLGCSSLMSVTLPNSIISIGERAFEGCSSLTSVEIPNSVINIEHSTFLGCSSLTSVTIPSSVTSIGHMAFCHCSSLTSIEIPNSVTSIVTAAFSGCSSLTSVTIPNSVTSIERSVFYNCSSLVSIEIPNSVTSIGEFAFDGCNGLTSITIPEGIMSIGWRAFSGCSSLTSITCKAVNPPTCDNVFLGVPKSIPVYVPFSSVSKYKQATGWSEFTNIIPL